MATPDRHQTNNGDCITRSVRTPRTGQLHPICIRPTAAQLAWLKAERTRRGLAINALVLLALEKAIAADPLPVAEVRADG